MDEKDTLKLKKPMKFKGSADGRRADVLRKSGGRSKSKRHGRKPRKVLTAIDDDSVLSFISFLETVSWDWKLRSYKNMLQRFAQDFGCAVDLSYRWRCEFANQHKDKLSAKVRTLFLSKRAQEAVWTKMMASDYFRTVDDLYRRLALSTAAECVWNLGNMQVVLPEPLKKSEPSEESVPEHVSALYAISAAGEAVPVTLLFKGARIAAEWKGLLEGADQDKVLLMVNNSGRYDPSAAVRWLRTVFLKLVKRRPVVVFVSGDHSPVEYYDFLKLAYDQGIQLVSVPKHLHSVKLPLAVSIWAATKDKWYEELDELQLNESPTTVLSRAQVVKAFIPAYSLLSQEDIKEGFASCGIFPLDADAKPIVKEGLVGLCLEEAEEEEVECIPLSPTMQQTVDEALEMYNRAGLSRTRARRLLKTMQVPGFMELS